MNILNLRSVIKETKLKPFVKWAGGKTQLLNFITILLPETFNEYFEPFLGGGSVFLHLKPKKATVSDLNEELINAWNVVKNNHHKLEKNLKDYIIQHNKNPKKTYLEIRENLINSNKVKSAARFIYLNKTGFNGLYRVNRNNKFNVPFGQKMNLKISSLFCSDNFNSISKYLKNNQVKIKFCDFKNILNKTKKGDFAFIDPPYDKEKNSFTSYTANGFNKESQEDLANLLHKLDKKGVKWMVTNHNTELINSLYKDYQIFVVPANRSINSKGINRKNGSQETIIINYNIDIMKTKKLDNELFYKELKTSSYILKEYVSWENIKNRLENNKILIHDLNYLLSNSKKEFTKKLDEIFLNNRQNSLKILPLLLGNRLKKDETFNYLLDNNLESSFDFNNKQKVIEFLEISGLINHLFINSNYKDLNSYILGTEVGLTSNDKKNKSGNFMKIFMEDIFNKYKIKYEKEVKSKKITNAIIKENKTFDFVINLNDITYCIECNFYNKPGSKINSEANRFIALNNDLSKYNKIKFIWVTDGPGLKSARNNINNALSNIEHMYNLKRFEEFIERLSFSKNEFKSF